MLSAASILGVEDCMHNVNRLEQVDNVIACLCDYKSMATSDCEQVLPCALP